MRPIIAAAILASFLIPASASANKGKLTDVSASRRHHIHWHHWRVSGISRSRHAAHTGRTFRSRRALARREHAKLNNWARPRAWCGWQMRQWKGVADAAYNLARNWAHWGRPASPGLGVVVVWSHHVGMITGRDSNGNWIIKSGNDGHRVRERPRSIAGAIAFRA